MCKVLNHKSVSSSTTSNMPYKYQYTWTSLKCVCHKDHRWPEIKYRYEHWITKTLNTGFAWNSPHWFT